MASTNKKVVYECVGSLDGDTFEGDFESVAQYLLDYKTKLHERFSNYDNFYIHAEDEHYSGYTFIINGSRLETDDEYSHRIAVENAEKRRLKKLKTDKLDKERKEYERLKKKFEK